MTKQRVKSKFNNYLHSDVSHPFAVDLVGTAVTGKRVHVPRGLLELAQALRRIVDEEVLVHDMVACEQDAYRRGEGEAAVAPVGGQPFVAAIGSHV